MPPFNSWGSGGSWSEKTSTTGTVGSFRDQLRAYDTFMDDVSNASSQNTDFRSFTASLALELQMSVMAEDAMPESKFRQEARHAEQQVKNVITSKFGNDKDLMRRAERIRQVLKDYQAAKGEYKDAKLILREKQSPDDYWGTRLDLVESYEDALRERPLGTKDDHAKEVQKGCYCEWCVMEKAYNLLDGAHVHGTTFREGNKEAIKLKDSFKEAWKHARRVKKDTTG